MPFDVSAFKVLIKKIFPPKKSVYTVDIDKDNIADAILIRAVNVVFPLQIPTEFKIESFDQEELKNELDHGKIAIDNYIRFYLDGEKLLSSDESIDTEKIQQKFELYLKNKQYSFRDIIDGNLAGEVIGLGDEIFMLIHVSQETLDKLNEGPHEVLIESEMISSLIIDFEITEENLNRSFPFE